MQEEANMWNDLKTNEYEGMLAETIAISGADGDQVHAYYARPLGKGPFPGVVLIPHMPGWDEFYRETTRRFAQHGYLAVCPDIFCRFGHGSPDEVSAKARAEGGVPDDTVLGDCAGALKMLKSLPNNNGKVGVIGTCSGGRHAFLAACRVNGFDAAVECWGGRVVAPAGSSPDGQKAPIDFTADLSCPLLGLFGNDDKFPTPPEVDLHEAELKKCGKNYEFHRYDGAGHGFWYYHSDMYRPQQAMDAWNKVFAFFGKYLKS
jgi:carboxymethylenebutenolidase